MNNADITFRDALSGSAEKVLSTVTEEFDEVGRETGRRREGEGKTCSYKLCRFMDSRCCSIVENWTQKSRQILEHMPLYETVVSLVLRRHCRWGSVGRI